MLTITAFIPARGGSKGIPNKNIKMFAGKPLIVHSIEYALKSKIINKIIVSTNDTVISKIAETSGAKVIIRPSALCTDTATTESAINHYINSSDKKPDIIVLLQATSPLRPRGSLDLALKHFQQGGYDSMLSICPTHRFFWRIKEDATAHAEYDFLNRVRRQDISRDNIRFIENGSMYIFTCKHFENTGNRLGNKIGYVEWPEEYSLEIDTLQDFKMVEKLYKEINK